jgi:hypothetical protein
VTEKPAVTVLIKGSGKANAVEAFRDGLTNLKSVVSTLAHAGLSRNKFILIVDLDNCHDDQILTAMKRGIGFWLSLFEKIRRGERV